MKNAKLNLENIVWILLLAGFTLIGLYGCRSKKTTTDFKQTEIENVSITDNSVVKKKLTTEENNQETKTETVTDKSFFEAWMSFESDKITITDKAGNKTEITNPRITNKSSQTKDIAKNDVVVAKNQITTTSEENQQNDVAVSNDRQIKTDLKTTEQRKTIIVWVYWIGGLLIAGFVYLILKRFKLI